MPKNRNGKGNRLSGALTLALGLALPLALAACVAAVRDPTDDNSVMAKCYFGWTLSFCDVQKTAGNSVIQGSGFIPSLNTLGASATEAAILAK